MTGGRGKNDLMGETSKGLVRECWIKETFGREKFITTPAMQKGTMVESDSLDLLEKVTGKKFFKNQKQLENDFITGTPDVIGEDVVIDIKSSWDIFTFAGIDEDKAKRDYFWQLAGYAWLTGKNKVCLTYVLVDTPDLIMNDELYRMSFKIAEEETEKYKNLYKYDDIDPKLRLKQYFWDVTQEDKDRIMNQVLVARDYMATLTL